MNKNLLAFFMSCLSAALLFSSLTFCHPNLNQRPIQVNIRSDNDVHDVVTAIENLHRDDIDISTKKDFRPEASYLVMVPSLALAFMIFFGVILFFYKWYCRWLGVPPSL